MAWARNQAGKKITAQAVKYYLINGLGFAESAAVTAAGRIAAFLASSTKAY
jgi:hypothetical protein